MLWKKSNDPVPKGLSRHTIRLLAIVKSLQAKSWRETRVTNCAKTHYTPRDTTILQTNHVSNSILKTPSHSSQCIFSSLLRLCHRARRSHCYSARGLDPPIISSVSPSSTFGFSNEKIIPKFPSYKRDVLRNSEES